MLSACNTKTSQEESSASAVSTPVTGTTGDTEGTGGDVAPNEGSADTTPPRIALNGKASITLDQDTPYIELGARAVDVVDGNVDVHIEGSVDSNTTGTYTITYSAKDKAGNESSVQREVNVVSKYKILITRKEGNTAGYGASAHFNIALSHKPTHPVEIFVESDNPNEGIVPKKDFWGWDMKTGRIVIHPEDWKQGEQIVVKGRNKNVINGKQDYHIVTSPAVSDDPRFDGVDAEDVWMRGEYLELVKPSFEHLFFVPGVESAFILPYKYSGNYVYNDRPVFTLLKSPKGMAIDKDGIYWTPNESDSGKHYMVEVEARYGKQHEVLQFAINVSTLSKPMKSFIKNGTLIIPSSATCDFGDTGLRITTPVGYENLIEDIVIREMHKSGVVISKHRKMNSCMFKIEGMHSMWRDVFSPIIAEVFNQDKRDKLKFKIELPTYSTITNSQLYSSDSTNEFLPVLRSVFGNIISERYYHKLDSVLFSRETFAHVTKQKNSVLNILLHDGVYFIGHKVEKI